MARELGYSPASLPPGGHVSVHLPDGEIWIGRVQFAEPALLVLLLWGSGTCRQFHVTPGVSAHVIEQCSYEETVTVTRRQRAGLPGKVDAAYAAKLARTAERERRRLAEHEQRKLAARLARMNARTKRDEGDHHEA